MDNQKILDTLSEIECALYYRCDGSDDPQGVSKGDLEHTHSVVQLALQLWREATGLTIS